MTKTVKLAFLASLVLNLLLLGFILGQVPRGIETTATSRHQRLEEKLKTLPEPAQSRFREAFAQIRASAEPLREQINEVRSETLRVLSAEPFDEAVYDQQMSKIEELRREMFQQIGKNMKQTAKQATPEERRLLAELLRRPPSTK